MRRKNTPQEAKKSREKKVRKSQGRKRRSIEQMNIVHKPVSPHSLSVLHRRQFPIAGE